MRELADRVAHVVVDKISIDRDGRCRSLAGGCDDLPHWFGSTGEEPAEVLSLFGRQGERIHVRATSERTGTR